MASINRFRTDKRKETGGVWVPFEAGISLLIARMPNTNFEQKVRELAAPHMEATRSDTISDELNVSITREAVAHTVLLDWKGVTESDEEGSPDVPYTPELGVKYFNDDELGDFYRFVVTSGRNSEQYRKEQMVAAVKN